MREALEAAASHRSLATRGPGLLWLVGLFGAASLAPLLAEPSYAQPLAVRFAPPVPISDSLGFDDEAAIAAAGDSVFVAWEDHGQDLLLFSHSTDRGQTFSLPAAVVPGDPLLTFGQAHLVSREPKDVRLVATVFDVFGAAEILYTSSNDGGQTFADAVLVSPLDEFNSYAPDIAGGWATAVAWSDIDIWTGRTAIQISLSDDDGATFALPQRVDSSHGGACCPGIALAGDQNLFVAWREKLDPYATSNGYELLFRRSLDGGVTFSQPLNLSLPNEEAFDPLVAADEQGNVYVLWSEGTYLDDVRLLLAVSHDSGATFEDPEVLAGPTGDVVGDMVVSSDGTVWVAWIEWDTIGGYGGFLTRSLDGARTFAMPTVLPGTCGTATACAYTIASDARDEIYVAEGPVPPTADIQVTRGDASTCGDANGDGSITATDALVILRAAVGAAACEPVSCDVDDNGSVSATDALAVLRAAVGAAVTLTCPDLVALGGMR